MVFVSKNDASLAFEDMKIGISIHFGLYSIGQFHEWHQAYKLLSHKRYKAKFFKKFDPDPKGMEQWVLLAKQMGAKYLICTTKHHDGFCLWDTNVKHPLYPEYHIRNTPFWKKHKTGIIEELFKAGEKHGVKIGLYYSSIDWSFTDIEKKRFLPNPPLLTKKKHATLHSQYVDYYIAQVIELIEKFPDTFEILFDGYQFRTIGYKNFVEYLKAAELYDKLQELAPQILISSNTGSSKKVVDLGSTDLILFENICGTGEQNGAPWPRTQTLPGETWVALNKAWGYSKKDKHFQDPYKTRDWILYNALRNSNSLFNFGPDYNGYIAPDHHEIGEQIGKLLHPFQNALYNSRSYVVESWGGILKNRNTGSLYAIIFPSSKPILIQSPETNETNLLHGEISGLSLSKGQVKIGYVETTSLLEFVPQ